MASHDTETVGASGEITFNHEEDHHRWAAKVGEDVIGALTYQFAGGRYILISTHVDDAYRHRGLATTLVRSALDDIALTGKKITIICPFVGDVIARHPEYFDLVDPVHPGSGISGTPHKDTVATAAATFPVTPDNLQITDVEDAVSERTARIMVLGTIAYRAPLTATGIAHVLKEWIVERWADIPAIAIDREVRALAESGLIRQHETSNAAEAEFNCTDQGRNELHQLLLRLLNADSFQPFSLMPLLHFITVLSLAELADGLRRRILYIDEVLAHESSVISHAPADGPDHTSEIVRVNWHRYNADRSWSLEFIGRLYGGTPANARTS